MSVDLSPLQNAVLRLEEALAQWSADTSNELIRDGLIQRFEFTYDLAAKMLRRVLAFRSDTPSDVDRMSFPTLMRTAFEQGVVDETWPVWLDYREKRNIASRTCDEEKAKEVAAMIPAFLDEVRDLAVRLARALDSTDST